MMKYDTLKAIGFQLFKDIDHKAECQTRDRIRSGQFGSAFMVKHTETGTIYCMKQIVLSPENEQSAMKEAVSLSKLALHDMKNVNVIQYHEAFIHDDRLCIITELCENGGLDTEIKRRAAVQKYYTEGEVMEVFVQILLGVAHIHNNRIVHRDLKAQLAYEEAVTALACISLRKGMTPPTGVVKVGDLGISKTLSQTMEQCKSIVGTPYYMAPEVCQNTPYSSKADVWSLGCILYELCMLRHAFNAESLFALLFQIINGKYEPIPEARYSSELASLLALLLQHDPEQRPSCKALLHHSYVQKHIEYTMNKTVAGQLLRSHVRPQPRADLNRKAHSDAPHMPSSGAISGPNPPSPHLDSCFSEVSCPLSEAVTPKQRMEARKRAGADLRLQQMKAHMDVHNSSDSKKQANSRKSQMIRGSLHGGGASVTPGQQRQHSSAPGSHAPHTSCRPPPLSLSPEPLDFSPVAHKQQTNSAYQVIARSGHTEGNRRSVGGSPGFRHSSEGSVPDENMWGMQSRQIISRYASHACASPLSKHSNLSACSSPGGQGSGVAQSRAPFPKTLHCDLGHLNVDGSETTHDFDASQHQPQNSGSSALQARQPALVIRFGMDTKERAKERALCSPSGGNTSPHSPSCFSQELACLSPISSPGAIRFGTAASPNSGLGFVLPAICGGPPTSPLEGVADQENAASPAGEDSDDISENYSDLEEDASGTSEPDAQSERDIQSLDELLENLQRVKAEVDADYVEEVIFEEEEEEAVASKRVSESYAAEATDCSSGACSSGGCSSL